MHDETTDLWLKKGEERRLRAGHLWVYSNEVDSERSRLKELAPGQPVLIRDHRGKPLGCGYANPHSLICARLVSRDPDRPLDRSLLVHRLNVALSLRKRFYEKPYYRLVYGESDSLPGLIVDRFDDLCVVQINTAGMERVKESIVEALAKVVRPRHILIRADSSVREMEGLPAYVEWATGDGPTELQVEENGARFMAPAASGQKTGWYFDHRENRARLARLVHGARVLDVFSYVGAWGVLAARAGAADVTCIDSSESALDYAHRNAELNGVGEKLRTIQGDAFAAMKELRAERERFDVVIVDPPAFIKRRKDFKAGLTAYRQLNQAAIQLLGKDGLLVSASCSAHLSESSLVQTVLASARHLDRSAQILEFGQQGPDHPVHPAIPETRYLKGIQFRILAP